MTAPERPPPHPVSQVLRGVAAFASALDSSTQTLMREAGVEPPQETGGQRFVRTLRRWADIVDRGGSDGQKR